MTTADHAAMFEPGPVQSPYLWHVFPLEELYKLWTFLKGGLWCAELGTIPTFEGDVEGTLPYGLFASCWQMGHTAPSQRAWDIFGAQGDGLAICTKTETMKHLAGSSQVRGLAG